MQLKMKSVDTSQQDIISAAVECYTLHEELVMSSLQISELDAIGDKLATASRALKDQNNINDVLEVFDQGLEIIKLTDAAEKKLTIKAAQENLATKIVEAVQAFFKKLREWWDKFVAWIMSFFNPIDKDVKRIIAAIDKLTTAEGIDQLILGPFDFTKQNSRTGTEAAGTLISMSAFLTGLKQLSTDIKDAHTNLTRVITTQANLIKQYASKPDDAALAKSISAMMQSESGYAIKFDDVANKFDDNLAAICGLIEVKTVPKSELKNIAHVLRSTYDQITVCKRGVVALKDMTTKSYDTAMKTEWSADNLSYIRMMSTSSNKMSHRLVKMLSELSKIVVKSLRICDAAKQATE